MPISPSSAESFGQCPRKYALEFCDVPKLFSEPLHVGSAMHRTFQDLITKHQDTKNWMEPAEVAIILSRYLRDFPSDQVLPSENILEHLHMQWVETGIAKVCSFLQHLAQIIESARVVDTEHWVKLDLQDKTGTVRATGRVDLLLEMPNLEIWVIDFKTGKTKDTLGSSLQLALYGQAAQLEHPTQTIRTFAAYLEPYQLLEYQTERMIPDLERLSNIGLTAFEEKDFPMQPSALCTFCDFFQICHPNISAKTLLLEAI